jgi:hypothetical protein
MTSIVTTSHAGRVPTADGRCLESRYLKRVRAGLIAQCGEPSESQRLLIDRIAVIALRVFMIDTNPALAGSVEYIELIRLQAELLAQLGGQPATPSIVRNPLHEVAA